MTPQLLRFCVPFSCCLTLAAATPRTDSWPGFRGPHIDGVAREGTPPVEFGPEKNVRWKVDVPAGHSSPVAWQEHVVVTGARDKQMVTLCLDRATGATRWERTIAVEAVEKTHRSNSQATPTPVTDGKAVFVYFPSFGLVAYELNGEERWRKPLPMPATFRNQGSGTSPILADGKLILYLQREAESRLLALDPATGGELWAAPMPFLSNSYSTPVAWEEGGRKRVGVASGKQFTAFDLADGKPVWWVTNLGYEACSTPIATGDRIVISTAGVQGEASNITVPPPFAEAVKRYSRDGEPLVSLAAIPNDVLFTDRKTSDGAGNMSLRSAIKLAGAKDGAKFDEAAWEEIRGKLASFAGGPMSRAVVVCARTGGRDDVTDSHVLWSEGKGVPEVPSPLVLQDRVYLIRSGSVLACRDLATGRLLSEGRIGSPGGYYASPVAANGCLYFASDRGVVTVVKATEKPEVLAQNKLDAPIFASPAVAADTLYIRTTRQLWAFAP